MVAEYRHSSRSARRGPGPWDLLQWTEQKIRSWDLKISLLNLHFSKEHLNLSFSTTCMYNYYIYKKKMNKWGASEQWRKKGLYRIIIFALIGNAEMLQGLQCWMEKSIYSEIAEVTCLWPCLPRKSILYLALHMPLDFSWLWHLVILQLIYKSFVY